MSNVPDYSSYVGIKKIAVAQTANTAIATVKGRAVSGYAAPFPLYKGIRLPANALLSNKFIRTATPPPIPNVLRFLIGVGFPFDDLNTLNGEVTNLTYDGVDSIYASCYYTTTGGIAVLKYSISADTRSTFITKESSALLRNSYGIAYDRVNSCIYHGNLAGSVQKIVVSGGTAGTVTNLITSGTVSSPYQIVFDGTNTLYVANSGNHTISAVNVTTGAATVFAGAAGSSGSTTDVTRLNARFNAPQGLVYDNTTNCLYVGDNGNFTIRKIDITSGLVTTIAGSVGSAGFVEGVGSAARFRSIRDLSIDTTRQRLFATEDGNDIIRQIDLATLNCTRIAGIVGEKSNILGPNGDPLLSTFNLPRGSLYITPYLYIADTKSNRFKRITINS